MPARFASRRRIRILLIVIAAVLLVWSAAWYAAASWLDATAGRALAKMAGRGAVILCPDRSVAGYPLTLRLSCTAARVRASEIRATLGGLAAEASLLHPATLVVDYGGPATVEVTGGQGPADATWSTARTEVRAGLGGIAGLHVYVRDLRASFPRASITAAEIDNLVAPEGSGSRITHHATGLTVTTDGAALPALASEFVADVSVPPAQLLSGHGAGPGSTVSGLALDLRSGALRLQATGDLSIDEDGLVDGSVTITMAGVEQLPTLLAAAPETVRNFGMSAGGAMMAVGRPTTLDGAPAHEVVLTIDRGAMRFGFMALGQIPPLGGL